MGAVRRKDYQLEDEEEILAFLDSQAHAFLSFVRTDGTPGIVAVNFVRAGRVIYFHGATEGEKMRALAERPQVALMAAKDFALLPSYFTAPEYACPASQYYKAVVVRGEARLLVDPVEKAAALQLLMEKLQPEGGHCPITAEDPLYRKQLATTGVVAVSMDEVSAKFKFGQNLPKRKRASIARQLEERGKPGDLATVEAMRAVKPLG